MPINKRSYERHVLIDKLLNYKKRWESTSKLFEEVQREMEHDSLPKIDKRTFIRDLHDIREVYLAPLNWHTAGYEEDDPTFIGYTSNYSIRNVPIEEHDIQTLRDAAEVLEGIADLQGLLDIEKAIAGITDRRNRKGRKKSKIYFEGHTQVDNIDYLSTLISAVNQEIPLEVIYKPYKEESRKYLFHPYVLREYRNRWFIIGLAEGNTKPMTFAIDRIQKAVRADIGFKPNTLFDEETYFDNLIGASPPYEAKPDSIKIRVFSKSADYILTKPIHSNQQLVDDSAEDGSVIIELSLYINFELKSTLLGYGDGIEVLEPKNLRSELADLFKQLNSLYSR